MSPSKEFEFQKLFNNNKIIQQSKHKHNKSQQQSTHRFGHLGAQSLYMYTYICIHLKTFDAVLKLQSRQRLCYFEMFLAFLR